MAKFKEQMKHFGRLLWDIFKGALPSLLMYGCAGWVMMMTCTSEEGFKWDGGSVTWTVGSLIVVAAYNALLTWQTGGSQYEMLVSGNIQRMSEGQAGGGYKISAHKVVKEYRIWKGFAIGLMTAIFAIIFGIVFGCLQTQIDSHSKAVGVMVLIALFVSGWSLLPLYAMNQCGIYANYFLSLLFVLIPILVSGGFYIAGAYARRNKRLREQLIAQKAAEAEANKVKKINYGALPGTRPKKRK